MIGPFIDKYSFLSNFHPIAIKWDGWIFTSVEHAYQAMKCANPMVILQFCNPALTPGQAKRMGRSVHIRPDWEEIKVQTMLDLLKCKFQDPELKQKLLDTGDEELVEYNTWGDNFWGRTMEGFGLNMLGKLLMEVRDGRFQ